MDFKFFNNPKPEIMFRLEPLQQLTVADRMLGNNVEYCYQFGNSEPVPFGNGSEALTITIQPDSSDGLTFDDGDNSFKIFARVLQ